MVASVDVATGMRRPRFPLVPEELQKVQEGEGGYKGNEGVGAGVEDIRGWSIGEDE